MRIIKKKMQTRLNSSENAKREMRIIKVDINYDVMMKIYRIIIKKKGEFEQDFAMSCF